MVVINVCGLANDTGTELVLTARIVGLRETGEPETVMAGAPGVRAVPATDIPLGSSLTATLLIVVTWSDSDVV